MTRTPAPGSRSRSTHAALSCAALLSLASPHPGSLESPFVDDPVLASTSRDLGETPPAVPDGLVLVDASLGIATRVLGIEGARIDGILPESAGTLLLVDAGDFPRTGRILRYDPRDETLDVVAEGGFLCAPRRIVPLSGDGCIVADEGPPSGDGALVQVDLRTGAQRLVAFAHLGRPLDLERLPSGELVTSAGGLTAVDLETGEQRPLGPSLGLDRVVALEPLPDGDLLVVGRRGGIHDVLQVDPVSGAVQRLGASPERIRDVRAAPDGSLWVAQAGPTLFALDRIAPDGTLHILASGYLLHGLRSIVPLAPGSPLATPLASAPQLAAPQSPRWGIQPPKLPSLPPLSIEVDVNVVRVLHGPGPEDDEVHPAGPYPLVQALRVAEPGSDPVIGVRGELPGSSMSIGGGDAGDKAYVVHWNGVPMRFAVIGLTDDARIRDFSLCDRLNDGTPTGGVSDAWFGNLAIEARYSAGVLIPKGHTFGQLRFYDVHFAAGRENLKAGKYSGYGYRWGVRGHGRGRWDFRYCTFDPVEEHCIYLDSPQGDCVFQNIEHRGSGRTAIQIVNRSEDNPGPSGFGTLLFDNVRITRLWGDGGSGITVAGYLGDVVFRHIQVNEDPAVGASHGAIAVWTDASPGKGLYLFRGTDGAYHSCRSVTLESITADLPHADRPVVAISGVETVEIGHFDIHSNQAAFAFDTRFGAPSVSGAVQVDNETIELQDERIGNGRVRFLGPCPLSLHPGFQTPVKVLWEDTPLSDAQIDQRWCP